MPTPLRMELGQAPTPATQAAPRAEIAEHTYIQATQNCGKVR